MYMWKACLYVFVALLPIGLLLRHIADKLTGNTLSWLKYTKHIMKDVRQANPFLAGLIYLEGIISNLALVGLIISIPVYFIFGK